MNGLDAGEGGPGGGIFNTGALTIDHSRIVRNHAGVGGRGGDGSIGGAGGNGGSGGGLGTAGMLMLTSTLVADNAAGAGAFSPSALAFTSTRVGGVRRLSVTARNTGLPRRAFPAVDVTGAPHFRLGSMTCSATLLGGASCAVTVAFTPKGSGARAGALRIGAQSFLLSGTGVRVCVVPKLKGKTIKQARKQLRKAHCKLGKVVRRGHGRPGRVRSTKPKAGAQRPARTSLAVVVNRRRAP